MSVDSKDARGNARCLAGVVLRGALGLLGLAVSLSCSSSLPTSPPVDEVPTRTYVYAFEPEQIFAYALEEDGFLAPIQGVRSRRVEGWSGVATDPFGRFFFGVVSEKPSAEIWAQAVDPTTGLLVGAPDSPLRPPGASWFRVAVVSRSGRFLFAGADPAGSGLGRVHSYTVDAATAAVVEVPGSPVTTRLGTYRLWPDPHTELLYVSNDQAWPGGPDCISGYRISPTSGALQEIESSPFVTPAFVNQMAFHHSGPFVYATAGHYLLAYRITSDGALVPLPVPDEPAFEPTGTYVFSLHVSRDGRTLHAFQQSGWILTYRIDTVTGQLSFVSELRGPTSYEGWVFHPTEDLVFMLGRDPTAIHVYNIDPPTGLLTFQGSPIAVDGVPSRQIQGETLFLDASAQILGVVVQGAASSGLGAVLHTYRIDLDRRTLTPIASTRLGETAAPHVVLSRRGGTTTVW